MELHGILLWAITFKGAEREREREREREYGVLAASMLLCFIRIGVYPVNTTSLWRLTYVDETLRRIDIVTTSIKHCMSTACTGHGSENQHLNPPTGRGPITNRTRFFLIVLHRCTCMLVYIVEGPAFTSRFICGNKMDLLWFMFWWVPRLRIKTKECVVVTFFICSFLYSKTCLKRPLKNRQLDR